MKAREKRNIKFDIYVNGEYNGTTERESLTPKQAIKLGETIAKNHARGNFKHIMVFVQARELAIADITARTEQTAPTYRKHVELYTRSYNID